MNIHQLNMLIVSKSYTQQEKHKFIENGSINNQEI